MLTYEELTKLAGKELEEELHKAGFDLMKLRLGVTSRQSKETAKLKALRKYLARIKTIKHMQELDKLRENAQTTVTK